MTNTFTEDDVEAVARSFHAVGDPGMKLWYRLRDMRLKQARAALRTLEERGYRKVTE